MDSNNETRRATSVDAGWRTGNDELSSGRKATQVEDGWRSQDTKSGRNATQIDVGWRESEGSAKRATEVDEGWRANNASKRNVTQVDAGWRQEIDDVFSLENEGGKVVANHFSTLDEFKDAVEKLSELKSSLGNIYSIKKTISRAGGEAIILLTADPNGNDVVAKVYYEPVNGAGSSISSRSHVLEYMKTDEGKKYTLAVREIGTIGFGESKYYFEIMPYCDSTDLSDDGAYSFDEIVEIARQLNEALNSMHQAGIIHRDIKPENLYNFDGRYVLGDFGIAKNGAQGRSHVTEHILGTEGYRAPEATRYVYSPASDYYSLGVTLASLFEGNFVFDNMTYEMQVLAQESERLPLVRVDSNRESLENLVNGLCRINPKQRFGYDDVIKWLADHNYTGGGFAEEWPRPFRMLNEEYRDEKSLFYGITKDAEHWNEGLNMLYSKFFENFFMSFRTDLARAAQVADELYRADDKNKGLSVFLKNLFAPGPIVWKGYTFNSLAELGNKMVRTKNPEGYAEILQKGCISHWLANTEGIKKDDSTNSLADEIEKLSAKEPEIACYWYGNSFATEKYLNICDVQVSNINELFEAMFSNAGIFYDKDGLSKLMDRKEGSDLYGFLFSYGYKEIIDKEWEAVRGCDKFNKASILFAMLDNIAVKSNCNPNVVRTFYVNYGPVGAATYTQRLVANSREETYMPLDVDGKQILSAIKSFNVSLNNDIQTIFKEYIPLIDNIAKLQKMLVDNPFCIVTGVYVSKGVICTNLKGSFGFTLYDKLAPLGYHAWINYNGGN
jgi:serine/threonine protein kinase